MKVKALFEFWAENEAELSQRRGRQLDAPTASSVGSVSHVTVLMLMASLSMSLPLLSLSLLLLLQVFRSAM